MKVVPGKTVLEYVKQIRISVARAPGGHKSVLTRRNCFSHWKTLAKEAGLPDAKIREVEDCFYRSYR